MKLRVGRSNEEKARFPLRRGRRSAVSRREPAEAISAPGKATEKDARRFTGTVELCRSVPKPDGCRTPLGRRLDELRERIKASGAPLLSWEKIDRELSERRGEARFEDDR